MVVLPDAGRPVSQTIADEWPLIDLLLSLDTSSVCHWTSTSEGLKLIFSPFNIRLYTPFEKFSNRVYK
jgi:hypothetical protein